MFGMWAFRRTVRLPSVFGSISPMSLRVVFGLAIALVFAITSVRYYAKAEKPSRLGELTRTAFLRWRPQILSIETSTNIYAVHNYPNPPIMALVLYPLAKLPPLAGAMTWFALKVLMANGMALWCLSLLRRPGEPMPKRFAAWGLPVALLLSLHPILGDLAHGNVNVFIAFLVVGSLVLYCRRWDFSSGIVLALAVACKVTPALFVPYFLWKRAWKQLAGCAVGLALWLFVVPGAALGWNENQTLLTSWFTQMVRPFVLEGKVTTEHQNQSLPGLAYRLLTTEPSFLDYDDDEGKPFATAFHNLLTLNPVVVQILLKLTMLLFAFGVVVLCRWPTHRAAVPRAGPLLVAEFSLILVGMLLFSERTWKHHAVILIVPFILMGWVLSESAPARISRKGLFAVMLCVGALMWVPSVLSQQSQDLAMVYGSSTAAFVLLLFACAYVLSCGGELVPQNSTGDASPVEN
jgi:alpha-1,2-mannosyltransferase